MQNLDHVDDTNLKKRQLPPMTPYTGRNERRQKYASTKSAAGREDEGSEYQRIAKYHGAPRIKINAESFITPDDPGYEYSMSPEWTDADLPIGSEKLLKGGSGVVLDMKKSFEKLYLAESVPEYVLYMFMYAVHDYKKMLEEPMRIIKLAVQDYVSDLIEPMTSADMAIAGFRTPDVNLTNDEIDVLKSEAGLVELASSKTFESYFNRWVKGSYISAGAPNVTHRGASQQVVKYLTRAPMGGFFINQRLNKPATFKSAWDVVTKLKTFDVNNEELSAFQLSAGLGLNLRDEPAVSKVDRYLILYDASFRYYVSGAGDRMVYYWDWVRNNAEAIGKYSGQWAQF